MAASADANVKVMVRFRPFTKEDKSRGRVDKGLGVAFHDSQCFTVSMSSTRTGVGGKEVAKHSKKDFTFDAVFRPESTQEEVFDAMALSTVDDVIDGFNGTIFAYGQTGSGKTYSMFGDASSSANKGIIPRAVQRLFSALRSKPSTQEVTIKASFLEIYKESVRDLLSPNTRLRVRERPDGAVVIKGLVEEYITSPNDLVKLIRIGEKCRSVSYTDMNSVSSRSHSVLTLHVEQKLNDGSLQVSKLHLADLAGSERVGKTHASGNTLLEAQKINQSLSALGNCINALSEAESRRGKRKKRATHIPYRDSRLTFILKDSLGGNTKTTLLVTCSPHESSMEETLSTLRFGARAKSIKNKAIVNKVMSVNQLENLVRKMKQTIAEKDGIISRLCSRLRKQGIEIDEHDLMASPRRMSRTPREHQYGEDAKPRPRVAASPSSLAAQLADAGEEAPSPAPSEQEEEEKVSPLPPNVKPGMERKRMLSFDFSVGDELERLREENLLRDEWEGGIEEEASEWEEDELPEKLGMALMDNITGLEEENNRLNEENEHLENECFQYQQRVEAALTMMELMKKYLTLNVSESVVQQFEIEALNVSGQPDGAWNQMPSRPRHVSVNALSTSVSTDELRKPVVPVRPHLTRQMRSRSVIVGEKDRLLVSMQSRLLSQMVKNAELQAQVETLKEGWTDHLKKAAEVQRFKDMVTMNAQQTRIVKPLKSKLQDPTTVTPP